MSLSASAPSSEPAPSSRRTCRPSASSQETRRGSCGDFTLRQEFRMSVNDTAFVARGPAAPFAPPASIGAATTRETSRYAFRPEKTAAKQLRVGVIGYGHWGPNIVRNLHAVDTCEVAAVCDKSTSALRRVNRVY